MSKKRTSLDAIFAKSVEIEPIPEMKQPVVHVDRIGGDSPVGARPNVKQQTAYLAVPVYEQLRRLAFEERAKMHDYLIEGLDHVFRNRGLPGVDELKGKGQ